MYILNIILLIALLKITLPVFIKILRNVTQADKNLSFDVSHMKIDTRHLFGLLIILFFGNYVIGMRHMGEVNLLFWLILFIFGFSVLSFIFYHMIKKFKQRWLNIIYFIGIFLTGLTSYQFASLASDYDILESAVTLFSLILVNSLMTAALAFFFQIIASTKQNKVSNTTILQHYEEAGMSQEDIAVFRKEMSEARDHIYQLEHNLQQTAKLRLINEKHRTIKTAQDYFQHIVQEPTRITVATHFLYKILPSLVDLSSKYNEISSHVAKNKQSYLILDKTAQMIDLLASDLVEDYFAFHEATFKKADEEIRYASKIIQAKHAFEYENLVEKVETEEPTPGSLDELLDEMNDFKKEDSNDA